MAPSQPFFHWLASNEELLQWHTDNFEIKGLNSSSPTAPYLEWMEKHQDFKQWHSQNFIKKNKAHSVFSQFLPFFTSLHRLFPSFLKRCFIKWTLFSSQDKHLELLAADFKTTKRLKCAVMSSFFSFWKIKHHQHKNAVLSSIAQCYQESLQLSLQEKNLANSQNFQLRNQLSRANMDIATQKQPTDQLEDRNKALQQQNAFLLTQLEQANKVTETSHAMISSLADQYHYLLSSRTPLPLLINNCS